MCIRDRDKVVWESFYCKNNTSSVDTLKLIGCKEVIHKEIDFYEHNLGEIIISNPPFSDKKRVLTRLKELGKPFIMILPCSTITTQYFRRLFQEERIQIIIPRKRIQFIKMLDGKPVNEKGKCNFDCFYFTWKMNLPKDIIWLKN